MATDEKTTEVAAPPPPSSRRTDVIIDNPGPRAAQVVDAPPVPMDPMELLHRIALGLERIARSEGSKAQPAAKDWAQLRRDIGPLLQAAGFDIPPVAVAPSASRRQPLVGARAPGSIAPGARTSTRVDIGASPYTAKQTIRRGGV